MTAPLHGIEVLDLIYVLAEPFCSHQLAYLSADVVKVEAPGRGYLARNLGADPALNAAGMGVSFLAQNVVKRSITLHLKHAAGKAALRCPVGNTDVVVEDFRPGVNDRLSLSAGTLSADNLRMISAAISDLGQDGPWRNRPAYHQLIQGAAGVMDVSDQTRGPPTRVG